MQINSVQAGAAPINTQSQQQAPKQQEMQAQPAGGKNPLPVAQEAEINASASLQAYRQQSVDQSFAKDSVDFKSTATLKNLDTVKAIEQMHANLNELVKSVRNTNEKLNVASEQIASMQGSLMAIAKNFPPYSGDSAERREMLMSYMSLRKEIESLMVPPPPPPVYEKVRSMWDSMFAQNGQIMSNAVPALEPGSSYGDVKAAELKLAGTNERIAALSDGVTQGLLKS